MQEGGPEERPTSKRVWLVTCIFFILIASGVTLLIMSMVMSDSETSMMLPAIGMALVAIPWLFWFVTCFYRSFKGWWISRQATSPPGTKDNKKSADEENNLNGMPESERPLAQSMS